MAGVGIMVGIGGIATALYIWRNPRFSSPPYDYHGLEDLGNEFRRPGDNDRGTAARTRYIGEINAAYAALRQLAADFDVLDGTHLPANASAGQ